MTYYKSGAIYGIPNNDPFIDYFGFLRNHGIFFDGRILGIFIYAYLYLILQIQKNVSKLEIIFLTLLVLTTVSRGAIAVYTLILISYVFKKSNLLDRFITKITFFKRLMLVVFLLVIGITSVTVFQSFGNDIKTFVSTFNLLSKENALSQRSIYQEEALLVFSQNPILGAGVGSLTAKGTIDINLSVGNTSISAVTDAFIFTKLGEMGIVGFSLFLMSIFQIIVFKNSIISYGLFLGFLMHLMGTDIPDIFMPYFCLLIIFVYVKMNSQDRITGKMKIIPPNTKSTITSN
jgi:O-antigen ligase